MPQVLVNIGGRSYRLACNAGEEEHLATLAKFVDGKIGEMHGAFRDIGDQRIVVMAALSIADELFEARKKAEAHAADSAEADSRAAAARADLEGRAAASAETAAQEAAAREAAEARAAELAALVEETAARVEALTETLNAAASEPA